jgi:hypothetical protein
VVCLDPGLCGKEAAGVATGAELSYSTGVTALQMANAIMGAGVTVTGASFTGDTRSRGTYANGNALSNGVVPSDTGVILSTGRIVDFTQSNGDPNRATNTSTNTSGPDNNAQLNALAGTNTFDAAILDIDFVPTGNVMTMTFVFASEEYPEFSSSQYNDLVGVWINGQVVPLGVGTGATSVTNVNQTLNSNLYVNNTGDQFNTEMDGFTLTLKLTIPVNAGVVNTLRIGIADVSDASYDSSLLIAGDSAQTTLVAADDLRTMFPNQTKTFDLLANDVNTGGGALTITHINGVAVVPGQSVVLPSGDVVRLNADMTVTVTADTDADTFNFTYKVSGSGQTDTGIVTVSTIPCFVAGTLIRTPQGDIPVEALAPGDLVETLDHGPQPVAWVGRRIVAARGVHAPVRIAPGTFGAHGALMVSPQHRVLVRDGRAELMFGETEVLIAARNLVDGRGVTVVDGGWVEYVHILFERHEIVWAQGLATESFLPGPQVLDPDDAGLRQEITALFPALADAGGCGPAARRTLRAHEARALFAAGVAA